MSFPSPDGDSSAPTLGLQPDMVVKAAGGLDALVSEFDSKSVVKLNNGVDAGHEDMTGALSAFTSAWSLGLSVMLEQQNDRATALRKSVTTLVGYDADIAYLGFCPREQP